MLEREMHKLLVERLLVVLGVLPSDVDPMDFFQSSLWESDVPIKNPEAMEAIGWIQGVADCHDVTIMTMLDEEQIDMERLETRALPRGRRRGRR